MKVLKYLLTLRDTRQAWGPTWRSGSTAGEGEREGERRGGRGGEEGRHEEEEEWEGQRGRRRREALENGDSVLFGVWTLFKQLSSGVFELVGLQTLKLLSLTTTQAP